MIKQKLVATVDKYTDRDGNERKRYVTVGHLHEGDYGDYITLDPSVSLGGVLAMQKINGITKREDSRIFVNLYDPQPRGDAPAGSTPPPADSGGVDHIPF